MDWIEDIVEKTYHNYKKRKVVLWGKYITSETIKDKLKEVYGIETAFFVDKDASKIDNKQVYPTGCLQGKSDEYYVVVPVAYYQSLKEELIGGGYKKDQDYYYFCDCIVKMTDDYYEDSHGNKIIGEYSKSKFVFSGFNSFVRIGEDVNLNNSCFYINNDVEIEIGDKCTISNCVCYVKGTHIEIGDGCILSDNCKCSVNSAHIEIGNGCIIRDNCECYVESTHIGIGDGCILSNNCKCRVNSAHIEIGDRCIIDDCEWNIKSAHIEIGNKCSIYSNRWLMKPQSCVKLGDGGIYLEGNMEALEYGKIIIGKDFGIGTGYWIIACEYTQIIVGDDVICSKNVILLGNDAHSIFDVHTGMNINSTEEISKNRKIVIGNHVWICVNAIILYDSEIHDGSIIGAGSLVKGMIPNNCIGAGTPARVIKKDIAWSRNGVDQLMEHEQVYARLTEM